MSSGRNRSSPYEFINKDQRGNPGQPRGISEGVGRPRSRQDGSRLQPDVRYRGKDVPSRDQPLGAQEPHRRYPERVPSPERSRDGLGNPRGQQALPPKPVTLRTGPPLSSTNTLLGELVKQAKLKALEQASISKVASEVQPEGQGEEQQEEDEEEDDELRRLRRAAEASAARLSDEEASGGVGNKRKHTAIVWQPSDLQARGLTDRVQQELELYQQQQQRRRLGEVAGAGDMEGGVDLDAPPAFKASPSLSRSPSVAPANGGAAQSSPAAVSGDGNADDAPSTSLAQRTSQSRGVTSRWVDEDAEDSPPRPLTGPPADGDGTAAAMSGVGSEAAPGSHNSPSSSSSSRGTSGLGTPGHNTPGPAQSLRSINMLSECRSVEDFERLNKVSEGTYGVVYRARDKASGKICALKKVKMDKEHHGFPVTSIREINILLNFHHPNIVNVDEVVVGRHLDQVYMVMEFMDHDLKCLMEDKRKMSRPFSVAEVKCLMLQLLDGVAYLHEQWVLHRDLKCANILYSNTGKLKICDFGMARQFGSPLRPYTHMVVTLWYRAPELLFGQELYSTAVDVWSVGCIMAELLLGKPLFEGRGELDQIAKIASVLGTPTEETWPSLRKLPNFDKVSLRPMPSTLRAKFQSAHGSGAVLSAAGLDLLEKLLAYDPTKRMSAEDAADHAWFKEAPLPQAASLMPTFKSSHDGSGGK